MNIRQLRTVVTFLKQQSFASTGDQIGLSPSAVSIQMLRLEQELGINLFNRTTRPPTLTVEGFAIAEIAQEILELEERIRRIAKGMDIAKSITIGFVPTTLTRILPRVISRLRDVFPDLQINIKSGLSGELATAVLRREIDFALITSPSTEMPELNVTEIAREPLFIVGPQSLKHVTSAVELVTALPFIAFNKRAWLGQKIAADLQIQAIYPTDGMEIDSLDTIEQLVSQGFGVSVIPQRLLSPPLAEHLKCLPFGQPPESRILSLIEHVGHRATELEATVRRVFQSLVNDS
ncbi:LysR substrate-binding domain-containing protein [Ochrobactrum vermis]|uniref:LysR substrate-binding domain-containing protein n=1 Tax=Ochrobactrum vermis TaxID=1827297 RepID=A0ABU8PH45_9HYPH|nr:LysR substrate-binding domain-containing protein [Ochrobactrum vermis]PQZ25885.1 hypothetical protein CQZ93_17875 [Ochrobactrum vermis]